MKELSQSFTVEYNYKVFFSEEIFNEKNLSLFHFLNSHKKIEDKKLLLIIDKQVINLHPYLKTAIPNYFSKNNCVDFIPEIIIIEGGETAKNNPTEISKLVDAIDLYGIDRHSFIVAIGGGAVLDMVGYVAATAHRGIKHIRIPTTVLSQNDSGVGVKNGINFKGKKNFLGCFAPPVAVFNDYFFLKTLSQRDWISGIAEAIKVALIKDKPFFDWIDENAEQLVNRNKEAIQYLIYQCAKLHLNHIASNDPFESGSSRPLDFGHWAAHKIENLTQFNIRHGEAVAIGMAIDTIYSNQIGLLSLHDMHRIINLLIKLGFNLSHPILIENNYINIWNGLIEFREHLGGELTIMLLQNIGKGKEVHKMDFQVFKNAINALSDFNFK